MSCGPTNALQKLSSHAQLDRSLQADQQLRQGPQRSDAFKTSVPNNQLEAEYRQHIQQHQQPQNFQSTFQQNFAPQLHLASHQQQQHQTRQSGGWANDFAALSLKSGVRKTSQAPTQVSNDWSSQFASQHLKHKQQHHQIQEHSAFQPQLHFNQANNMMNFQQGRLNPQVSKTEHQQLHDEASFHNDLESEFMKLEQEFEQPKEQELPLPKESNQQFKTAAQEIANVMNTSNDDKFTNSKFLQLMNMVSQGKVELDEDEAKLVDQQGNDIHELKLDESERPNFDFLEEDSSAFERTQRDPEGLQDINDQDSHRLPDPLEGLTAEDLTSPFEAARRVATLHHERYTWDEFDDYRNDDTSF